jgi:hypothetical protein
LFPFDGRPDGGRSYSGFNGGFNLYVLDGRGSDDSICHASGGHSRDVLHQGYNGSDVLCYPAGSGDGESDAHGSDDESFGGVLTVDSRPYSSRGDVWFHSGTDLYVLDGCGSDDSVCDTSDGHSGHVFY